MIKIVQMSTPDSCNKNGVSPREAYHFGISLSTGDSYKTKYSNMFYSISPRFQHNKFKLELVTDKPVKYSFTRADIPF